MTSVGESVVKTRPYAGFMACLRGEPGKKPANSSFHEAAWPDPAPVSGQGTLELRRNR